MLFWRCFSRAVAHQSVDKEDDDENFNRTHPVLHSKRAAASRDEPVLQLQGLPETVGGSNPGASATVRESKVIISSPLPSWLSLRLREYEFVVQSGVDTWTEDKEKGLPSTRCAGSQSRDSGMFPPRKGLVAAPLEAKKHSFEQWLDQFKVTSEQLSGKEKVRSSWGSSFYFESESYQPVSYPEDSSASSSRGEKWGPATGEEEPPNTAGSDETYWADSENEEFSPSWVEEVLAGGEERQWVGREVWGGESLHSLAVRDREGTTGEDLGCLVEQTIVYTGGKATLVTVYRSPLGLEAEG